MTEVASAADPASGMFRIEVTLDPVDLPLKSGLVAKLDHRAVVGQRRLARLRADRRHRRRRRPHGAACSCSTRIARGGAKSKSPSSKATASRSSSGVEAGEQVITDGALYLEDGEQVAIAEPLADARSATALPAAEELP